MTADSTVLYQAGAGAQGLGGLSALSLEGGRAAEDWALCHLRSDAQVAGEGIPEYFVAGIIRNHVATTRGLLTNSRSPNRLDELLQNPIALSEELAWCVRKQAGSDLGLALHAIPDSKRQLENMSGEQTFISITDGERFINQTTTIAGRGLHDRTRMMLATVDLLRTALLRGLD